jgi:hypothetical protein
MKGEGIEEEGSPKWNKKKEEDHYHTPVAGSSCRDPTSGLARGVTGGSPFSPSNHIRKADQMQTSKNHRINRPNQTLENPIRLDDLHRLKDDFSPGTTWCAEGGAQGGMSGGDTITPVAGSSWGNPPSGLAQGCIRGSQSSPNSDKEDTDQIKIRKLERPRQLTGDGKSYLRCSPLAAKFRLGSASLHEEPVPGLTDVCSNVGLIDKNLLQKHYPDTPIHPTCRKVSGVGEKTTIGFSVIPLWLECRDDNKKERILVEFDVEVHVLEAFAPGLLIGLDAIRDYGIDIITSRMQGRIDGLSFPLFSTAAPKFQSVKVFSDKRIVVPGRSTVPIPVSAACMEGIDYIFTPYLTAELSIPAAPQMPRAIIDSHTKFIMFSNHSEHPMKVEKRQVLGDADAALFGTIGNTTPHVIRWDDLIQPRQPSRAGPSIGLKAPTTVAMEELLGKEVHDLTIFHVTAATAHTDVYAYEDELRFDELGRERPRKRSLPETSIRLIASNAEKRSAGDSFPENLDEDADVLFPRLPVDDSDRRSISHTLSQDLDSDQVAELLRLLNEFDDIFSDGSTIGQVKGILASIQTAGELPPASRLRPIGPAKRQIVEDALRQMENWDVIERSNSPTASAVVLVWQNNKWRFCVDFRQLNKITTKDSYPMLRSDYIFSSLAGKRFFSALDAIKGYHQVEIAEQVLRGRLWFAAVSLRYRYGNKRWER